MRANRNYFPNVNFNTSAFLPPLSYATILFNDDQRWSFKLAQSHGVTVWEVLEQIIQYLQMPDATQDLQAMRASATPNPQREIRYPSTLPGAKRIDMLRGRRMFKGLTPASHGDNCWFVNIA
jgi:hypothetical protein